MNTRTIAGPLLILLGAVLLLNKGADFGVGHIFELFWPTLFVIPVGLLLHWLYFSMTGRKGVGLLVAGGTVLVAGVVSQIAMLTGKWEVMWPGFILAPAVGLLELYWFGTRNRWLLIPINILTVLSLLFFIVFSISSFFDTMNGSRTIIAVALIAVGAYMMMSRRKQM
ncbi:hypothetical protein ACFO9Q_20025 [Paenibacillus sp. GCM10023252]|uniref:hypothetical protein n=1 Tax=Paenibacillus sp. GCM10023252 TaxID=3252649 RepID=UPI0036239219